MPMRALFFFSLALAFTACSSQPSVSSEEKEAAAATDQCLADPKLAAAWGECNVKSTIFQQAEAIAVCQGKFSKPGDTLMLKIRLKPNGRVQNVRAEEGKPRNKNLELCLSQEIAKLKFAAPPKGVSPVIYFPFQQ